MSLGEIEVTGTGTEAAEQLWGLGARRVRLPNVIDFTDSAEAARTVHAICLVRDLTSLAVHTDWQVRLTTETGTDDGWLPFSHLHPPRAVLGVPHGEEILHRWREEHYICKCLWRQGPGFVQIRDRRWGELRRFTVDEADYQRAIALLTTGAPVSSITASALADFREEKLIGEIGELAWWQPYRVRRWMEESIMI
ncbi:DUF5825 family protein [Streptomyces antioxidans]|nr:DUF5825 family protein [Streptomyces antioxidans]